MDIEAERVEGILAEGGKADVAEYARQASAQRRLLEQLGFEQSIRDDVPTVEELIREHAK